MQIIKGNFSILGVIGSPISHTLSPLIHNYWLEKESTAAVYIPLHFAEIDKEWNIFLSLLKKSNFRGLNITIPYKEQVFQILEKTGNLTERAFSAQAVNTIFRDNSGEIIGDNTDGQGFLFNIERLIDLEKKNILIIGAGGATRGILQSLLMRNCHITIINRTYEKALKLKENFSDQANSISLMPFEYLFSDLSDYDLIINTTALNALNQDIIQKINFLKMKSNCIFHDISYKPLITPFLKSAQDYNLRTIDGLGMLIGQAFFAYKQWFPKSKILLSEDEFLNVYRLLLNHIG